MSTDADAIKDTAVETYPLMVRAQSALDAIIGALERETKMRQDAQVEINEIRETFGLGSLRTLVEAADDYKTAIGGAEADRAELRRTKAQLERTTGDLSNLRRDWDDFVENNVPRSELTASYVTLAEHEKALGQIQSLLVVLNDIAVTPQNEPRRVARSAIAAASANGHPLKES